MMSINKLNQSSTGIIAQFIHKHIILILTSCLCISIIVALAGAYYLSTNLVNTQALQQSSSIVRILSTTQAFYSSNVTDRIRHISGVTVGPEYRDLEGGIPNPATYTIELGESLGIEEQGISFRLYSEYPFHYRLKSGGPRNQFEEDALNSFKTEPEKAFYREEKQGDLLLFRYAEAVVMGQSCVDCHNTLPDSPKKDWKVGDVRGAIAVSQPVSNLRMLANVEFNTLFLLLTTIAGLVLTSALVVFSYLRNVNQVLEQEVETKTATLKQMATIDSLTLIANRRMFDETLLQEWKRMQRQELPLTLMLCDIDYFKFYNDTYGHQAGDECLQTIASNINKSVQRTGDLVARYGGEEFAIILPNTHNKEAQQLAEKVINVVRDLKIPHSKSNVFPYVTLSIGITSIVPKFDEQPATLINLADKALYQAKANGRNQFVTS